MTGNQMQPDAEPFDPVSVERAIRAVTNDIGRGVPIVARAYEDYLSARRAYESAEDRAYFNAAGPVEERKRTARMRCEEERALMDAAEVAYKRAQWQARALADRLSGLQSSARMVERMYGAAGVGDR